MSSGTRLREAGQRRASSRRRGVLEASTTNSAEHRVNTNQIHAIEHLWQSSPAIQAARTVLCGQLLSGGISLRKDGEDVQLTPAFKMHLNEVWIPFAGDVIDSFLKWGLCPIVYEELSDEILNLPTKVQKVDSGVSSKRSKVENQKDSKDSKALDTPVLVIPHVPILGSYEVAYRLGGRMSYKREYMLYSTGVGQVTKPDEYARVVVRQHPDATGNVNSPVASVFELGSFIGSLNELALTAESSRARPHITTQLRKKDQSALDPGTLFFDSESRGVQANVDSEEGAAAARSLQMQQQLCQIINKLQTSKGPDHNVHSFSGQYASTSTGYAPPEIPPSLFTLPKEQEMCPNVQHPESRGDLEGLSRMVMEQFASALGVPADLIFSGRFAGKSTSQMSLLNITVSQLAKSINSVLTTCYRDIYAAGPTDSVGQLQLLTSPLSATDEVLNLFTGGLVPVEIAVPSVLHALGATKEDCDSAVERAVAERDRKESDEQKDRSMKEEDHKLSMQTRKVQIQNARDGTAVKAPEKDAN